jgi:hypothetical protein
MVLQSRRRERNRKENEKGAILLNNNCLVIILFHSNQSLLSRLLFLPPHCFTCPRLKRQSKRHPPHPLPRVPALRLKSGYTGR